MLSCCGGAAARGGREGRLLHLMTATLINREVEKQCSASRQSERRCEECLGEEEEEEEPGASSSCRDSLTALWLRVQEIYS